MDEKRYEQYKHHSVLLNSFSWKIAQLLGYVTESDNKCFIDTEKLFEEFFDEFEDMKYRLWALEN